MGEDRRSEFERDYGRSLFSTPVRRLQDKAQVFPLDPHDAVRTRLTHSLEVSSVARGLARQAASWMLDAKYLADPWQAVAIEDIATTCALIHDLGNPPFGHAGERAISEWFERQLAKDEIFFGDVTTGFPAEQLVSDFCRFEGNAQTLRIVTKLQFISDRHGLNLTAGTLSALCKYLSPSHQIYSGTHERSKPGFFASEWDIISRVRELTGTGDARNPITYLVEACDDIVYCTVDIEDGVKKGVVSWTLLEPRIEADPDGASCLDKARRYVARASPALEGRAYGEAMAQMFRTFAITRIASSVLDEFKRNYSDIMEAKYQGELTKGCTAAPLVAICKSLAREHIYNSEEILRLEVMGRQVIHSLMDLFWEAASSFPHEGDNRVFSKKLYNLLSRNYRAVFEEELKSSSLAAGSRQKLPEKYHKLQLVTDYVCGMTDTFACTLHRRLTNG